MFRTETLIFRSAVLTAEVTINESSLVFADTEAMLKKSNNNVLGRLLLPFRFANIDLLRSQFDKLKSTSKLLIRVSIHAYLITSIQLDCEVKTRQREEIRQFLEQRDESTKTFKHTLPDYNLGTTDLVSATDHSAQLTGIAVATAAIRFGQDGNGTRV